MSATEIVLPRGVERVEQAEPSRGMIVNETDLPDAVVQEAIQTHIEENASVLGIAEGQSTFQMYSNQGGLLARPKFRTPANVIEEIVLARDIAERDDDVGLTMGMMQSVCFGAGMAHSHRDEVVEALFDKMAEHANLDSVWYELYREWLIAGQVNTVTAFTRNSFQFQPEGADRQRTRDVISPRIGVLPAENIRVVGNDLFGTGTLAFKPATATQERWLAELFDDRTSPARKAELRRKDPVMAATILGKMPEPDAMPIGFQQDNNDPAYGQDLYRLNPRMVARSTMAKGAWNYPRPPLTRNFALLEAKRLLNLMDYALLQGGSNYLVVAKKGSDQKPAMQAEVDSLRDTIRRASRTGVLVGDHRLQVEIITPDLGELLSETKRGLIGRKLANALLRVPEADQDATAEFRTEVIQRVLEGDRRLLKRHVESNVYDEAATRNSTITSRRASVWFPKIILGGTQWFTDYVLKARDRGDISRHTAVEIAGFDYDSEVRKRKLEKPDDRVMVPAQVPFSSPNAGPQDNSTEGRPAGSGPDNGRPGARQVSPPAAARPRRQITQNAGETVTAMYDEEVGSYRIGELTYAILDQYADTREIGRLTRFEREAVAALEPRREGPLALVPVNVDEELGDIKVLRLAPGLSMIVGQRDDDALLARALCFREPEFSALAAQETAMRWGFHVPPIEEPVPEPDNA